MKRSGFDETNLIGKCGTCKFYVPYIQETWKGEKIERARGRCKYSNVICQIRTYTCNRYEERERG